LLITCGKAVDNLWISLGLLEFGGSAVDNSKVIHKLSTIQGVVWLQYCNGGVNRENAIDEIGRKDRVRGRRRLAGSGSKICVVGAREARTVPNPAAIDVRNKANKSKFREKIAFAAQYIEPVWIVDKARIEPGTAQDRGAKRRGSTRRDDLAWGKVIVRLVSGFERVEEARASCARSLLGRRRRAVLAAASRTYRRLRAALAVSSVAVGELCSPPPPERIVACELRSQAPQSPSASRARLRLRRSPGGIVYALVDWWSSRVIVGASRFAGAARGLRWGVSSPQSRVPRLVLWWFGNLRRLLQPSSRTMCLFLKGEWWCSFRKAVFLLSWARRFW